MQIYQEFKHNLARLFRFFARLDRRVTIGCAISRWNGIAQGRGAWTAILGLEGVGLLLIPTIVFTSKIHGIGCFSQHAIRSRTVVWQHHPLVDIAFTAAQIRAMPAAFQVFMAHYGSKEFGEDRYTLCSDNARFINHADPPNLTHKASTIVANRDIVAGEELTLNYQFVDDPNEAGNILAEISSAFGVSDELTPKIKGKHSRVS